MPKSDAEPLISPAASRSNLQSLRPNSEPELLISTSASGSDLPPLMPKSDAEPLISPAASRANLPSLMPKPEAEPLMSPAASGSNLPSLMPKSDTEPLRLATPPARTNPQCRHNPRQSSGTCPLPSPQASYLRCPGKRISAHSGSRRTPAERVRPGSRNRNRAARTRTDIVQKSREIVQKEIAFSTPPFQTLNRSKMVFGRFVNPKTYVVAGVQKCRNRSKIVRNRSKIKNSNHTIYEPNLT